MFSYKVIKQYTTYSFAWCCCVPCSSTWSVFLSVVIQCHIELSFAVIVICYIHNALYRTTLLRYASVMLHLSKHIYYMHNCDNFLHTNCWWITLIISSLLHFGIWIDLLLYTAFWFFSEATAITIQLVYIPIDSKDCQSLTFLGIVLDTKDVSETTRW